MKFVTKSIKLPEGYRDARLQVFDQSDGIKLFQIYREWRGLCDKLASIESRSINLPEGLSEGAFALAMNAPRVSGGIQNANSSFDCFELSTDSRIQVKACSVLPDLTSFGPNSQWDKLFFCDFFKDGSWSGKFDIYHIPNDLIYNHKVNKDQTFRQQQQQSRRPRFSIYKEIILAQKIQPSLTYDLSYFEKAI
jgi:hypothetical protein